MYEREKCTTCCRVLFVSEYNYATGTNFTEKDYKNDNVVIHTMDEFTTSANNEVKFEEGTLTISAQVIDEFLANVDANGSDMILIFTDQDADGEDANAKELTIAIKIIVEAEDVE